jgi:hypothetical protein
MESTALNKKKLLQNKNVMQRVLECFELKDLLEWRLFSKTVANEIVPRCIKKLIYRCPDPDDEVEDQYTFQK